MHELLYPVIGFEYDDEKDEIWFTSVWNNYLVCYSLKEKQLKRLEWIPEESNFIREIVGFSDVKKVNEQLILLPCNGSDVYIYNIDTCHFSKIGIFELNSVSHDRLSFMVKYDDYIYAFPRRDRNIYQIDIKNRKYKIIGVVEPEEEVVSDVGILQTHFYQIEKDVFFLSAVSGEIFKFDCESFELTICYKDKGKIFNTITQIEKNIFLLSVQSGDFEIIDM